MRKIIKNLGPYWKSVVLIILLLMVQAYCDLSLPTYTSGIIDTGIQNRGIEHIMPEKITEEEFLAAQIFMDDDQKTVWNDSYEKSSGGGSDAEDASVIYERTVSDEEKLEELDEDLLMPIVMTYQLGHMEVDRFKEMLKEAISQDPMRAPIASQIDDMSVSEISQMLGMDITSFEAKDEKGEVKEYVDMRPMMQAMIASGMMDEATIADSRAEIEETIDTIGSSTLKSMGTAYAAYCDEQAGMDVPAIQKSYLWSTALRMIVMALCMMLASIIVGFIASRVGAGVGRDLRSRLFSRVMSFSNSEMDKFSTASLITRCTNDVQQVQIVSVMFLRMVLFAPIMGIWGVIKVAQTGAHMSWVIILGVVTLIAVLGLLMAIAMPKFKIMQKLIDAVNRVSREILTGIPVIRAFGREKTEEKRFDKANTDLMKTQLFANRVMVMMMPIMQFIMSGLVVLITWVAAHKIDEGTLQVGAMTAFITYSMMVVMSFLIISAMAVFLPRAGVAAERIDEVLRTESSITEAPDAVDAPKGSSDLVFSHVSFRYPGAEEDVLTDIDFTAEPGKTTAIIGSTGSGKSTLVNLIPRFFDVTGGSVTLGGTDVRKLKLSSLRDHIGFVPQKGVLFSGTIDSNIRFGAPGISEEAVREAAATAQATEFIEEKEDGFESYIAQGGTNVSGGQKQRLSIARAIAKDPEILVFDDSFSALDMKTDAELRKALAEKNKDAVKIIVAQRISTILGADQILVLDEGKLVGKGTHEELMKDCEVYQQIARSQLSAADLGRLA